MYQLGTATEPSQQFSSSRSLKTFLGSAAPTVSNDELEKLLDYVLHHALYFFFTYVYPCIAYLFRLLLILVAAVTIKLVCKKGPFEHVVTDNACLVLPCRSRSIQS